MWFKLISIPKLVFSLNKINLYLNIPVETISVNSSSNNCEASIILPPEDFEISFFKFTIA